MSSARIPHATALGGHKERSTSINLPKHETKASTAHILKRLVYDGLETPPSQLKRIGGVYVQAKLRERPLVIVKDTNVKEGVYKRTKFVSIADAKLAYNPPLLREVRGGKKSVWL